MRSRLCPPAAQWQVEFIVVSYVTPVAAAIFRVLLVTVLLPLLFTSFPSDPFGGLGEAAPPSGAPPCSHFGGTARPANEAATRSWLLPAEEDSALGEDNHTSWLSSRQQESYENPMMLNAQAQYDFVLNQQQRA